MNEISENLKKTLEKEIPVIRAEIQTLYASLDKSFKLHGSNLPITFGFETDSLGSYNRKSEENEEYFHFSLFFAGYGVPHPLSKEDRKDLFLHEYAHYMQYNMPIPKKYQYNNDLHGSAWKYCCSLIGADPTPYYRAGAGLMKHDYEKALKNPWTDPNRNLLNARKQEQDFKNYRNSQIRYSIGDAVEHPKFGTGVIEDIEQLTGSVRLTVRFGEDIKKLDQKWLIRAGMSKQK